jgi:antitoxin CptB
MTGMTRSSEGLDERRRRILFRSWHRGMREMDLIMGSFADALIDQLTSAELDDFERLMDAADPDVYTWIVNDIVPPAPFDCSIVHRLREFHRRAGAIGERG